MHQENQHLEANESEQKIYNPEDAVYMEQMGFEYWSCGMHFNQLSTK